MKYTLVIFLSISLLFFNGKGPRKESAENETVVEQDDIIQKNYYGTIGKNLNVIFKLYLAIRHL